MRLKPPPCPRLTRLLTSGFAARSASSGPRAAVEQLVADLRKAEDFQNLFYALLLKKRVELGVSPFPTGPCHRTAARHHEPYEQAIRDAGREVGHALLERKQYAQAWAFFRMLGEPEPVKAALEAYSPGPDDDVYPVIEIAWQNAVLPKKGFDLVLDRHGVCSAITMVSSSDITTNAELRDHCVGRLVRAIHAQLLERLRGDAEGRGLKVPRRCQHPADRRGASRTLRRGLVSHRHVASIERRADEHLPAEGAGQRPRSRTLRLRPQAVEEFAGAHRGALRGGLRRLPRLPERDRGGGCREGPRSDSRPRPRARRRRGAPTRHRSTSTF